jgi:hypothetical protein
MYLRISSVAGSPIEEDIHLYQKSPITAKLSTYLQINTLLIPLTKFSWLFLADSEQSEFCWRLANDSAD